MIRHSFLVLWLAWRNVIRHSRRSLVNLFALSLGCAALVILGGFMNNFTAHFREPFIHSWSGHAQVARTGYWEKGTAHPEQYLLANPARVIDLLRNLPHVQYVMPRLEFGGLLSTGETSITVLGQGVVPRLESAFAQGDLHFQSGSDLSRADPRGVILGSGLAQALQVKVGDRVSLIVNTFDGSINGLDLRVRGIFRTGTDEHDNYYFRIALDQAQHVLATQQVQTIMIGLDNTDNMAEFRYALALLTAPGDLQLEFRTWDQLYPMLINSINWLNALFKVVRIIVLIIVGLTVVNTISQTIQERIGEIGTILALGSYRRQVLLQFLGEGAILSVLGGALGVAGSYVLIHTVLANGIVMPAPPGGSEPVLMFIDVFPRDILLGVGLSLLTALLACTIPAYRASRLPIIESLRANL